MIIVRLLFIAALFSASPAVAGDIVSAAADLASSTSDTDPNAFWLMMVSIGMLFTCALTLISATSLHVFKRKTPGQQVRKTSEPAELVSK